MKVQDWNSVFKADICLWKSTFALRLFCKSRSQEVEKKHLYSSPTDDPLERFLNGKDSSKGTHSGRIVHERSEKSTGGESCVGLWTGSFRTHSAPSTHCVEEVRVQDTMVTGCFWSRKQILDELDFGVWKCIRIRWKNYQEEDICDVFEPFIIFTRCIFCICTFSKCVK